MNGVKHLFAAFRSQAASPAAMACASGLWLIAFDNLAFWRDLWAARDPSSLRAALAVAGLALVLWSLFTLLARLLCWPRVGKPMIALLLAVAALAAYFIGSYGILIDRGMMRNVLQTDLRETADLLSLPLLLDFAWRGLLPAALVLSVRVAHPGWRQALAGIARSALLFAVLAVSCLTVFYADYASAARNHRELRHLLTPTNVFNGLAGLWKEHSRANRQLVRVGEDARRDPANAGAKPLLVVLVVGETARAANFSLGGYARPTNQALAGKGVVYFGDVTSCGTDTATSLPCMFSDLGAGKFEAAEAGARENVLDILARAGVGVRWLNNNSGCKGVCDRILWSDLSRTNDPALCAGGECLDGVLLQGLRDGLAAATSDNLMVLHLMGSHGPAYYKRYPAVSRRFEPTCDTNDIQRCSVEALRNTYDNGIAYTSEVLAKQIDLLAAQAGRVDSVLLYISDHGESLGERNIYLHGLPKVLAPREQTQVPMLAWLSPGAWQRLGVNEAALRQLAAQPLSHDNLSPTLLGLFGVRTSAVRSALDLTAMARRAATQGAGTP
ncbi:phosphoethanolamine transferase [Rhodoferax fermentans]|uniref:Phosphoethanolamine transferase n=1 Tax=Rhodoferax fermentans TaxID=28066 RepID=A0A1T1AUE3_RHOFE|nr:phosphoethanolamine--lipid A transferase [Rhodoferax fermentans]OOV05329.1 hypothetical protein RF819_00120 [Rhodoferax fermentans]OOV07687.1 hypothetical protein RF819_13985 [Rhodoferax fermentans]